MKKYFLFIMIAFMLFLTSTAFAANFTDVPQNHWAYESINEMLKRGIINGYPDGSFLPGKSITRAEFAKIFVLSLELTEKTTSDFADVNEKFWAYDYIKIASNYLAIYNENNELYYRPNEVAIREEVAAAIVKAVGLEQMKYDNNTLNKFSDKDEISEDLRRYVALAVENGLMQGNLNGTFNPKGKLTRAEVSKLIMNSLEYIEKNKIVDVEGTIYEDIVKKLDKLEIMQADENRIFKPDNFVTRAEFVKILIKSKDLESMVYGGGPSIFTDVPSNHWANGYIMLAISSGVIESYSNGTFKPDEFVTYEEAVAYALKTLSEENNNEAIKTELIDGMDFNLYTDKATKGNIAILIYNMLELNGDLHRLEKKKIYGFEVNAYEKAIEKLKELELVELCENPDKKVTKAETSKFFVIISGLKDEAEDSKGITGFSDVPEDYWASGYINVAVKNKFVLGYPNETFQPERKYSYVEALTTAIRFLGYKEYVESKGTWPYNYILKGQELGLLDNIDFYSYNDEITNKNMAILLYNMLNAERFE